eukprot:SAG22_NODE_634_length_8373_cov_4.731085_5_plen_51_part_00
MAGQAQGPKPDAAHDALCAVHGHAAAAAAEAAPGSRTEHMRSIWQRKTDI